MKTVTRKATVKSISIYADGNGAIITSPTPENPKGIWTKTAKQLERFANQVGAPNAQALKNVIADGTLSIEGKDVKVGESWTNETTGESGTYTKDHFRVENETLSLSPQGGIMLLTSAQLAKGLMSFMTFGAIAQVSDKAEVPAIAEADEAGS